MSSIENHSTLTSISDSNQQIQDVERGKGKAESELIFDKETEEKKENRQSRDHVVKKKKEKQLVDENGVPLHKIKFKEKK